MAGQRTRTTESRAPAALALVVVALLVAGGAALVLDPSTSSSEHSVGAQAADDRCTPVRLAVPGSFEDPARAAVAAIGTHASCGGLDLLVDTDGTTPSDLRVVESSWSTSSTRVLVDSLASTPVVNLGEQRADTWAELLRSPGVVTEDPASHTPSALALLAAADTDGVDQAQFLAQLVASAQGSTDDAAPGDPTVTTEQAAAAAGQSARAPQDTPFLDFPLLQLVETAAVARAGEQLVDWFASPSGHTAVTEAGFRGQDRAPATGRPEYTALAPAPGDSERDEMARLWNLAHTPLNALLVLDSSGSMAQRVGGVPRAQIVVDGLGPALDQLASRSRVGLWSFALNRGQGQQDWLEVAPTRELRARVAGGTQRDLLRSRLAAHLDDLGGGTGLFDTVLAAYTAATENYREGYENSILLVSDGSNDDSESVEFEELITALTALRDERAPVRIIGVQVSSETTSSPSAAGEDSTIAAIAAATGGFSRVVDRASDLSTLHLWLPLDRLQGQ